MKFEDSPKSIKYYVKKYLLNRKSFFEGKKVIDFPAGNGVTSRILKEVGATPLAMDLFPEYFEVDGLTCERANIRHGLPGDDYQADALICQEGIEHFSDQFGALKEFNRVLKPGGTLLVTTPNYSNIRAKLSYLLGESSRFNSTLAPNELDSIWMSKQEITDEIYFGHIFLIGVEKLRVLAKLSGFKIKECHMTRVKTTSLFFLPFIYPFILISNGLAYRKSMRKNKKYDMATKKEVYKEVFRLATSIRILISGSLMVEFIKEKESFEVAADLRSNHKDFGIT